MVASQAKPKTPCKIRRPRPGSKTEAILTLTATTNATPPQIADTVKVSRQAVHDALKRYGLDANTLDTFKNHRADILTGVQDRILGELDSNRLKKASVNNLAYAYMQFSQAERLERGQTTTNIGQGLALSAPLQEAVDRIVQRLLPVDNPVSNPVINPSDVVDV